MDKSTFLATPEAILAELDQPDNGPVVAVIIPAHQEALVIANTLAGLRRQTVQPTAVIVAANGCTDGTEEIAHREGALVFLAEPNRQKKAGALNMTLEMLMPALGNEDFVLVADADTQLSDDFIEVALRHHRDRTFVGGVGGAFEGRPTTSIVGTLQQMEYRRYLNQIARFGSRAFVLSGTGCLFSVEALRSVKAARVDGALLPQGDSYYDTQSLTEDNEMTLALLTLGWRCLSPSDMRTTTDVMETWGALRTQRERWYLGAMWNLRLYGRKMPLRMRSVYWRQQFGLLISTLSMILFVAVTAVLVAMQGMTLSSMTYFYLAGTALVLFERVKSIWSMGVKARVLVLTGLDQAYSMFLTSVYAMSLVKCVRGSRGVWVDT